MRHCRDCDAIEGAKHDQMCSLVSIDHPLVTAEDCAPQGEDCPGCGQPKADHVGPPAPPLTRGVLGAAEDRPGSCLTKRGVFVHRGRSPQGEDHEAGIEAVRRLMHRAPYESDGAMAEKIVAAYFAATGTTPSDGRGSVVESRAGSGADHKNAGAEPRTSTPPAASASSPSRGNATLHSALDHAGLLSRVSPSRDGSVAAYERANERLEVALLHIINRISTEGRDDEHKHLFLVGSEAVKHARAEVENLPSRDGSVAVDPPLSERERDAIEAMRAAVKIVGGEEPVPYDIRGMAAEVVRLRAEVERLSSRDGTVAVEDVVAALRAKDATHDGSPKCLEVAADWLAGKLGEDWREFSPASSPDTGHDEEEADGADAR